MPKVFAVAWRDFKYTVLTKAFVFAVVGIPILMMGVMAIAVWVMQSHEATPLTGTVVIATDDDALIQAAQKRFDAQELDDDEREQLEKATRVANQISGGASGVTPTQAMPLARGEVRVTVERADLAADPAALKSRLREGDCVAVAIVHNAALIAPAKTNDGAPPPERQAEHTTFDLFAMESLEADHVSIIERRIARAVAERRIQNAGLQPTWAYQLVEAPESNTVRLLPSGEESPESEELRELKQFIIPISFMMLLWIATFSSGQQLMMSTIEEKSNKVMEVLLSAVSALQLMTGKILGQCAAGLIIVAVYSSVGIASLIALSQSHLVEPIELVYLGVYFFMAYFMVAALMAAVGSAVSDIREANTLLTPVMLLLTFPLLLWMPISQSPNGAIATTFSFIPPAIPFAMILRVTADEPIAAWQIALSIGWGTICMIGMVWMASKIFRVGVLMTGKPPSPLELLKWLRYS